MFFISKVFRCWILRLKRWIKKVRNYLAKGYWDTSQFMARELKNPITYKKTGGDINE